MVSSILHRAAGIALAAGTVLLVCLLTSLAAGPEAYAKVQQFAGSVIGMIVLLGFTWSLSYHLLNGLRHLLEDTGRGFAIQSFVMTGWVAVFGSFVLNRTPPSVPRTSKNQVFVSPGASRFISSRIGTSAPSIATSVWSIALSQVSAGAMPPLPSGRS